MAIRRPRWLAPLIDIAIGLALAWLGYINTHGDFPDSPLAGALMALAGAAQMGRRVWPRTAFITSFALMSAVALIFGHYESGGSLLIGLVASYSAAVAGVRPWLLALVIGGFAAALNIPGQAWQDAVGDSIFVLVVCALPVGAGLAIKRIRDLTADLEASRAAELQAQTALAADLAVNAERSRIQREMHDILAHSLGVVVLQTGAAEEALKSNPALAGRAIGEARTTAVQAVGELRALLQAVGAESQMDRSPAPRLEQLPQLAEQASAPGFTVTVATEGTPRPVPAAVQASLYRIAQEGVTNALKHSGGRSCRVILRYSPDDVEVEVVDDGTGVQGPGARVGLAGVNERALAFGGHASAGPDPDGGWRLRAVIPVPA